jgi:signal transduction histidine kinase
MSDEVVRRCMEPYFSTKTRSVSTGLGLAFVRGLVTGAGGRVEIDSVMGRGTTVSLMLPTPAGWLPSHPARGRGAERRSDHAL